MRPNAGLPPSGPHSARARAAPGRPAFARKRAFEAVSRGRPPIGARKGGKGFQGPLRLNAGPPFPAARIQPGPAPPPAAPHLHGGVLTKFYNIWGAHFVIITGPANAGKAVTFHGRNNLLTPMGRQRLGRPIGPTITPTGRPGRIMLASEAKAEVRRRGFDILRRRCGASKDGKGFICPFCGHGGGGDGVTPVKGGDGETFHCFGCGKSGDVYDFLNGFSLALLGELAQAENLGVVEPDKLAARPQQGGAPAPPPKSREQIRAAYWAFARESLQRGFALLAVADESGAQGTPEENELMECARYVRRRGISQEQAAIMGFGCDPHAMPATHPYEVMTYGGEARIIYPCNDCGGYQARAVSPNAERPKLTAKGEQVGPVGLESCNDFRPLWITEGIFDRAVVAAQGCPAICLNGLSNLDKTLTRIESGNNCAVVIATDADRNGAGGGIRIERFINELRARGKHVARALPPYGGEYRGGALAKRDLNGSYQAEPVKTLRWIQEIEAQFEPARPQTLAQWAAEDWRRMRRAPRPEPLDFGDEIVNEFFAGSATGATLIAGATGAGKTTLALNLACMLCERGRNVIYAAYEQSTAQLAAKIWVACMAKETGHPPAARDIFGRDPGAMAILDSSAAVMAFNETAARSFTILSTRDGGPGLSAETLLGAIDDCGGGEGSAPVLFVDYVQLLGLETMSAKQKDFRLVMDESIAEICRGANERGAPVFMLSAITRAAYGSPVTLSCLKETSMLEYAATCVCGLDLMASYAEPGPGDLDTMEGTMMSRVARWREQRMKAAVMENPRRMVLTCLKNRYGAAGRKLAYKFWTANETVGGWARWDDRTPYCTEGA